MRIQLEYSPKTGCLNYGRLKRKPDENQGYKHVCSEVPIERANQFTEWIIERYPAVNSRKEVPYPDIAVIRKEFFEFLKLDQEFIETDMNRLYRDRAKVLNNRQF
jgi:hypothetical protein